MLIIVDDRITQQAKKKLAHYGEILGLRTENITYPAISGHPDIFFCQGPEHLIVAPNLPERYFEQLQAHRINFIKGQLPVGAGYPASARYNAVVTSEYLIHNLHITDKAIISACQGLTAIHISQGYCRCNLLPLKDGHFITSDKGLYKFQIPSASWRTKFQNPNFKFQISKTNPHSTFNLQPSTFLNVSPEDILLDGFTHGFFGGCCGVWEDKVFVNGSLRFYKDGEKVRIFLANLNYKIIELHVGPLVDTGSIFFI